MTISLKWVIPGYHQEVIAGRPTCNCARAWLCSKQIGNHWFQADTGETEGSRAFAQDAEAIDIDMNIIVVCPASEK